MLRDAFVVIALECYSCNHTVSHPSECNTTETCGPDMRCVAKHLRAVDGHNEYLMRCENKVIQLTQQQLQAIQMQLQGKTSNQPIIIQTSQPAAQAVSTADQTAFSTQQNVFQVQQIQGAGQQVYIQQEGDPTET